MSVSISISNLHKSYNNIPLYKDFDLEIEPGRITTIFGPNGSGKSTLFNILVGIVTHDSGKIKIKGLESGLENVRTSYIFQNYRDSLLPWKNNFENLAFPLRLQKIDEEEVNRRIKELIEIFEFECNWKGYPYELSGGQQQILAFMRALVSLPNLLFIDEPFSALDYENNLKLRRHLLAYYLKYKPTIVIITHNIEEAVHLSHKIVVLKSNHTRVGEIVDNPLPYPRSTETLKETSFELIKRQVLSAFQKANEL